MELLLRAQHNDQDAVGDLLGNPGAISPRYPTADPSASC